MKEVATAGNSQNTTKVWENFTKQGHEKTWESWGE